MKKIPWSYEKCKELVHQKYDKSIYSYFDDQLSSAGKSNANNIEAFHHYKMIPTYMDPKQLQKTIDRRILTLSSKELGTTSLEIDFPFFVCPFTFPTINDPSFTLNSLASQCEQSNIQCILPVFSYSKIEDYPASIQIFALNITCFDEINRSLIQRLKNKKIKIMILTIDTQYYHIGSGIMDSEGDVTKSSMNIFTNLLEDPYFNKIFYERNKKIGSKNPDIVQFVRFHCGISSTTSIPMDRKRAIQFAKWCMNQGFNCMNTSSIFSVSYFKDLAHSSSPLCESLDTAIGHPMAIVIKGILSVKDALLVQKLGVDGIYVSNHGGRFVWNCVPTLQVLSPIHNAVKKINPDFGVWFDSGIRHGADIITALQLGAEFVGICRPLVYSFALNPKQGVTQKLEQIKTEYHQQLRIRGSFFT